MPTFHHRSYNPYNPRYSPQVINIETMSLFTRALAGAQGSGGWDFGLDNREGVILDQDSGKKAGLRCEHSDWNYRGQRPCMAVGSSLLQNRFQTFFKDGLAMKKILFFSCRFFCPGMKPTSKKSSCRHISCRRTQIDLKFQFHRKKLILTTKFALAIQLDTV